MKIVILDAATLVIDTDIDFSIFDEHGEVIIYQATKNNEIKERIKDADVVLCNKTLMTKENLEGAQKLKYIGLFATGYNNIDLEYTKKHGITVCNAGSYSTEAVTQHVFAFILHYYNTISKYNEFVKKKGWVNGKTSEYYRPNEKLTRAEFAVIITRILELDTTHTNDTLYYDVNRHWAKNEINVLTKTGIIEGYADKSFRPDESITREEVAKILSMLIEENGASTTLERFFGCVRK